MIKNFKPRLYQETIFAKASQKNSLIVLPTGLGKTNIFLMLAAHRLKQYPKSKILLIGPTRPLIDQYFKVFTKNFDIDQGDMVVFTGQVKPEIREKQWKEKKIIFSTPQGLENDIITNRINLREVSLLGFDEAHRAVGEYSYVFIAKQYEAKAKYPRIVALTASPGSEVEKINEVIQNLFIEDIEIRTDKSADVQKYIQKLKMRWIEVTLPEEFKRIQKYLKTCYKSKLSDIKEQGYLDSVEMKSKREILGLQARLQGEIGSGNKDFAVLRSISLAAEALKVHHAIELLESQGISALFRYMEQIENSARTTKVKAVLNMVKDVNFKSALILTRKLHDQKVEHPKFTKLKTLVLDRLTGKTKLIVFTQYRDSGQKIVDELNKLPGAKAVLFVGQAKKNGSGLSQKKQLEIIEQFSAGEFNILVSSSVGEEGLDIPQVDGVIFYEPIPSAIRHIQRRGRTARLKQGEALVLMTKNTVDEAYRWTAHHKEKRMHRTLEGLKGKIELSKTKPLDNYMPKEEVRIYADHREKGSGVIKELLGLGTELKLEQLDVGDFILSRDCGVEFKNTLDFVDSLIDGRLLQQVKELKHNFARPLIVIEGATDIYSIRNVHPNAIRGLLATITVSYGVPILQTNNFKDTASLLHIIAKREQETKGKEFSLHTSKKRADIKEQQEYVISALPMVGPTLAKPLLKKFGSVKNVINASEEDLKDIDNIGDKKASAIKRVTDKDYG